MADVIIQQIRLDADGRLRLRVSPSRQSGYEYIWRDATNVAWDERRGQLYARDLFTDAEQFKRIVSAVASEYGDQLVLAPSTVFVDLPESIIVALRDSST
jgi:hypothetical protein